MGLHYYRCSRCRTRNRFKKAVSCYKISRKCRDCGYGKFYVDKERVRRVSCQCLGSYFWGPHRWGAKYCEKNPEHEYHRAVRDGASVEDLAWHQLGQKVHEGEVCPF